MSPASDQGIRHQLGFFGLVALYFIIRFIGISNLPLNLWQQIYWGNIIKATSLLFLSIFFIFSIFSKARQNPQTGPTIIKGFKLKKITYTLVIFFWLSIIAHIVFDSLKLLIPYNLLTIYQFSDLMDEAISHIFMFLSGIGFFITLSLLEIERPLKQSLNPLQVKVLIFLSFIFGSMLGLNLTEGYFSSITSVPLIICYLIFIYYIFKKHKLKLSYHPWNLISLIGMTSSVISFATWSIIFRSVPQFFSTIK